ncbi:hypothetical protein NBRC10512v2_003269 [Rhodotorula toruloides]
MWRMVADWVLHPVLLGWLCVYLILRDPELERLWRLKDHVVESLLGGHEPAWRFQRLNWEREAGPISPPCPPLRLHSGES